MIIQKKRKRKNHEKHYEMVILNILFSSLNKRYSIPNHRRHVVLCISKAFSLKFHQLDSSQKFCSKKQKQACKLFVHDPWYRRLEICKYRITRGEQGLRAKCQTVGELTGTMVDRDWRRSVRFDACTRCATGQPIM